jgi:hypothetical protein
MIMQKFLPTSMKDKNVEHYTKNAFAENPIHLQKMVIPIGLPLDLDIGKNINNLWWDPL